MLAILLSTASSCDYLDARRCRAGAGSVASGPTITVATVGTALEIMDMFQGEDLVSREELDCLEDILCERTETAIKMGAELEV
mmetsp:Transcript_59902/g.177607  ORF Transcript_59902/g.177607 Transcript_59902/m.177607 type:complete len:83 (-) Transcript_59902:765-1013(-)